MAAPRRSAAQRPLGHLAPGLVLMPGQGESFVPCPRQRLPRRISEVAADLRLPVSEVRRILTEHSEQTDVERGDLINESVHSYDSTVTLVTDLGMKLLEARVARRTQAEAAWRTEEDEYQRRLAIRRRHEQEANRKAGIRDVPGDFTTYFRLVGEY
jgi:hypothetical protein